MRATFTNGQLEAVLVTYTYGAAAGGGVDSNARISFVKGALVHIKTGKGGIQRRSNDRWAIWSGNENISPKSIRTQNLHTLALCRHGNFWGTTNQALGGMQGRILAKAGFVSEDQCPALPLRFF
jgi:hypothetical protein